METLTMVADFINKVGFPIFVALYVLLRTEPILRGVSASLVKLITLIETKLS